MIGFAEVPTREVRLTPTAQTPRLRQDGTPALRIHDNVVIAPEGRAIEAIALGPVSVEGNQVTALGSDFQNTPSRSPIGLDVPEGSPLIVFTSALGGAVVNIIESRRVERDLLPDRRLVRPRPQRHAAPA